ncbi:hypothetical protein [Candidatus Spongiihabitans sp.]|uniref:hypothetical protein n=1 Tax=Candidatus Spongiihabitans sp. TaxID=3101308 RepID=UPI003C7D57C1
MKLPNCKFNIDSEKCRVVLLFIAGFVGLVLGLLYHKWNGFFGCLFGSKASEYLQIIVVSLFVFLCLWWFRTRDVREQISKTEMQIQHNNLSSGLDNLSNKDSLKIDIGVAQLLELSKLNSNHDATIRIAFIRRLKKCPLTKDDIYRNAERLVYAQHILKWFVDKDKNGEADVMYCKFDCQDFTKEGVFYEFFKKYKNMIGYENRPAQITWTVVNIKIPPRDASSVMNDIGGDDTIQTEFTRYIIANMQNDNNNDNVKNKR